jgi:hypothetical protein
MSLMGMERGGSRAAAGRGVSRGIDRSREFSVMLALGVREMGGGGGWWAGVGAGVADGVGVEAGV